MRNATRQWNPAASKILLGMALDPEEIGDRIKAAREAIYLTQLQFAAKANVSPSTVARWEAGKLPPVRELIRVAPLLEIDPEQLVEPTRAEGPVSERTLLELLQSGFRELRAGQDEIARRLDRLEAVRAPRVDRKVDGA